MNQLEIEQALLLRDSGELSPERERELEAALRENPEAAAWADAVAVLHRAEIFASRQLVPPLDETTAARITRVGARPRSTLVPRLLALAAGVILAAAMWPMLAPDSRETAVVAESSLRLPWSEAEDPVWSGLDELSEEVAAWEGIDAEDPLILADEHDWAEWLLDVENPG